MLVGSSADQIAETLDLRALPSAFYEDPYPIYHALRRQAPVKKLPDVSYFLTRYADLSRVYRDTKTYSSDKKVEFKPKYGDSLLYEHHTTSLVFNDPPLHTRVRRLITDALSPKAMNAMEDPVIFLVDRLLDDIAARGRVDLIADFASAIPVEVIGNLLGVPHGEREPLRDWSLNILGALEPVITPEAFERAETSVRDFLAYLRVLVADRRAHPNDAERDVLTRLIAGEAGGERLSETELLQNCIFILNAGHETTTNLIGNGLHALLAWPEEQARLRANPSLAAQAVEEMLRFDSSNQFGNRATTTATVLGDVALAADSRLTLCIGAANRDPEQFRDPDRFDITRTPNRHLAFGTGAHQCAGLHLARLEGRIAIRRFLERFSSYRLAGEPIRGGRARFRGFVSLPVEVEVASRAS
jgi:cytochrome P450